MNNIYKHMKSKQQEKEFWNTMERVFGKEYIQKPRGNKREWGIMKIKA